MEKGLETARFGRHYLNLDADDLIRFEILQQQEITASSLRELIRLVDNEPTPSLSRIQGPLRNLYKSGFTFSRYMCQANWFLSRDTAVDRGANELLGYDYSENGLRVVGNDNAGLMKFMRQFQTPLTVLDGRMREEPDDPHSDLIQRGGLMDQAAPAWVYEFDQPKIWPEKIPALAPLIESYIPEFDLDTGRIDKWHFLKTEPCKVIRGFLRGETPFPDFNRDEDTFFFMDGKMLPALERSIAHYHTMNRQALIAWADDLYEKAREILNKQSDGGIHSVNLTMLNEFNRGGTMDFRRSLESFSSKDQEFREELTRFRKLIKEIYTLADRPKDNIQAEDIHHQTRILLIQCFQVFKTMRVLSKQMPAVYQPTQSPARKQQPSAK